MTKGLPVQLFTDFQSSIYVREPPTTTAWVLDMYISRGLIVNVLMTLWPYIYISICMKASPPWWVWGVSLIFYTFHEVMKCLACPQCHEVLQIGWSTSHRRLSGASQFVQLVVRPWTCSLCTSTSITTKHLPSPVSSTRLCYSNSCLTKLPSWRPYGVVYGFKSGFSGT